MREENQADVDFLKKGPWYGDPVDSDIKAMGDDMWRVQYHPLRKSVLVMPYLANGVVAERIAACPQLDCKYEVYNRIGLTLNLSLLVSFVICHRLQQRNVSHRLS